MVGVLSLYSGNQENVTGGKGDYAEILTPYSLQSEMICGFLASALRAHVFLVLIALLDLPSCWAISLSL